MKPILSLVMAFAMFGVIFSVLPSAYSQTSDVETSEQTTFSGNLLNDPMALEILKKIEESKRKIIKLQEQNYDNLESQKFIEDRRALALERLNQSLTLWEEKWHEFSPKMAYQKFVDKMPSFVQGTFLKQFQFTEAKHNAGLYAKSEAISKGADSELAAQKFAQAAKSTIQEISEYNIKIQPNYVELTPKEKFNERIAYWDDTINKEKKRLDKNIIDTEHEYSIELYIQAKNERNEIREIIKNYDTEIITKTELSEQIGDVREKYKPIKEQILKIKNKELSLLELKDDHLIQKMNNRIQSSENKIDTHIQIVWNSDTKDYDVVPKYSKVFSNGPIIIGLVTSPTQIELFWDPPIVTDEALITGYKIEVKPDNESYVILVENTGNTNTSYTHTDLISGEFYTYRISAITYGQVSDPSNEIGASTAIS